MTPNRAPITAAARRELIAAALLVSGAAGLLVVLWALSPLLAGGVLSVGAITGGLFLAAGKE